MTLLSSSLIALLSINTAEAKGDKPISDHTKAVTVQPFMLLEPRVSLEYDHMLSDTASFSAGATFGTFNSLLLRLLNGASDELGGPSIAIQNIGINGAYNKHFKHFNRGWYTGAGFEYDQFTLNVDDSDQGTWRLLEIGPHIGYRIAGEGGFTFTWDWGLGYSISLGDTVSGENGPDEATRGGGLAFMGTGIRLGWSF